MIELLVAFLCFALMVVAVVGIFSLIAKAMRNRTAAAPPSHQPEVDRRTADLVQNLTFTVRLGGEHRADDAQWLGPGQSVRVRGQLVEGGLLYVGRHLNPVAGLRSVEPALVNPDLPTNDRQIDWAGDSMPYWPSYSEIPAECRGAYLRWLTDGRRQPGVGIGYVFLFFYGLERRILHDGPRGNLLSGEQEAIIAELERLLGIYGGQRSFSRYAREFLTAAQVQSRKTRLSDGPPPQAGYPGEFPLALRVGLAEMSVEGRPIPAEWALTWVRCHPETRLRTPAQRCASEFERLFGIRYAQEFGVGLVVKPNRTRVTVQYRPASASFGGPVDVPIGDLPDVTALSAPVQRLRVLAERCSEDLEAYSRLLGREPGSKGTISAIAVLPPDLASHDASPEAFGLFGFVRDQLSGHDVTVLPARELLNRWRAAAADGRLAKTEAITLAQFLQKCGFGIEPDVRFGGRVPKPEDTVAVFRLEGGSAAAPTPSFRAASALLHMAVLVAQADGSVDESEEVQLLAHVGSALHLDPHERRRLAAHVRWQLANKATLTDVKKTVGHLDQTRRNTLGAFLVGVAAADGRLDRKEIATLLKVYGLLGLQEAQLFDDLHSFGLPGETGPVKVSAAEPSRGFSIPAPSPASHGSFVLDPAVVRAKLEESAAVAALLDNIFTQDEAEPAPPPPVSTTATAVAGLDVIHSGLLRELASNTSWERARIEACASRFGVLPDGAIEVINERALDLTGEPLLEGEDPISLNPSVLKELMA